VGKKRRGEERKEEKRKEEKRRACKILVGNLERKKPLGRSGCRWEGC
jgi:hypothetical protein